MDPNIQPIKKIALVKLMIHSLLHTKSYCVATEKSRGCVYTQSSLFIAQRDLSPLAKVAFDKHEVLFAAHCHVGLRAAKYMIRIWKVCGSCIIEKIASSIHW